MLTRLYVHNFRCFINFEISFDRLNLLLGSNGVGKSTLFDVIFLFNRFIIRQDSLNQLFLPNDLPVLGLSREEIKQVFEIDVQGNDGHYRYRLVIQHELKKQDQHRFRMFEERLTWNDQPLFEFSDNTAQIYRDDQTPGPRFPMSGSESGVGWLMPSEDNRKLVWFRQWLSRLQVVRITPSCMVSYCQSDPQSLALDLANFAAWYQHLLMTNPDLIHDLTEQLRDVLPGYRSLGLQPVGNGFSLIVKFRGPGNSDYKVLFEKLSDGQKCLIALYTLLAVMKDTDATLCIDEPENFLALSEVGHWLNAMDEQYDRAGSREQFLVISHHPKVMNFLTKNHGLWLDQPDGVTRVQPVSVDPETGGLSVAKLMELDWLVDY